ncbi:glycoside hydrolase superfamily [Staphylotrichum tortipilum]|uniref:starch synthase (maltosyl-transferring) n=1 Tax=Staphylotrichum tortipilum TaxID=2831512 RepID=A0AAN6MAW6_9PEZI|nr:glycoside hydrolase superfamily [Staphylotrichum longicolle]
MNPHIHIEAITPNTDQGAYPVKRIVGDPLHVAADIFRDGHEAIRAQVRWHAGGGKWQTIPMAHQDSDRWAATVPLTHNATVQFCIDAWTDVFGTWLVDLRKKVEAGLPVPSEVAEGIQLVQHAINMSSGADRQRLTTALSALRAADTPTQAAEAVRDPALVELMDRWSPHADQVTSPTLRVTVDRPRAAYSTWYEMFPRSQGRELGKAATLRHAAVRLPDLRAMGFDVVYLPPIHPIGTAHRKGPNNSLVAGPDDPGCPWAIGGPAGGHTAIDPGLGTLADFDAFVAAAAEQGLEVALDFAIQCSPDHPWVQEHPAWFHHRPDGTIKYAENPPKVYHDIYPVNFDTEDREALWQALRDVLLFWIDHGVKIFRVDKPHTKPFPFWAWVIADVQNTYPDVIFLAEAFTRPKVMKLLAKVGFTQSYTYFTWRNHAAELRAYLEELCYSGMQEYFRPNFWLNTPDILPEILQTGGKPAFKHRLVLAATLSPSYGIYSGFELCENAALPGSEEYLNSEKYEVRVRDWNQPGNIKALITQINCIRAEHPALQRLDNVQFFACDNDRLLVYGKRHGADTLLIAVNLDPHAMQHGYMTIPADFVGIAPGGRYEVVDRLSGAVYNWGERNYVRLDPQHQVAHILKVHCRL